MTPPHGLHRKHLSQQFFYLTLHFAFMPSMYNVGYYSLVIFLNWHYLFRPNQPSSGLQAVTIKESAAHCNAVLFLLCSSLWLLLAMWVNHLFYLGVHELYVFAIWFCLVCWLWLSWMLLLGQEFIVWWSAITVIHCSTFVVSCSCRMDHVENTPHWRMLRISCGHYLAVVIVNRAII
jgi:hypothetical protein